MSIIFNTMRNSFRFIAVLAGLVLLTSTAVQAAQFSAGEEYSLSPQETVSENLYTASGRATVAGRILGDVVVAAGAVVITGEVTDDVLIAGGSIDILGPVSGDIRVVGGEVVIGDSVGGEVVIVAGSVHVLPDAVIEGGLHVTGGEVILDGSVDGDMRVKAGRLVLNGTVLGDVHATVKDELKIGSNATVAGALQYRAPKEASLPDGFLVPGGIIYDGPLKKLDKATGGGGFLGLAFLGSALGILAGILLTLRLLAWLGFALLVVWLWRRWVSDVVREFTGSFWKSLGQGLLVFFVSPLAIALLLLSFIGTFIGFAAINLYVLLLLFSRVFAAIILGAWLGKVIRRRKEWQVTMPWTIAGVVGLQALYLLPVVGWIVSIALTLTSLGVLFRLALDKAHR